MDDGHSGAERLRNSRPNEVVQKLRQTHDTATQRARATAAQRPGAHTSVSADRYARLALGDYWWVGSRQGAAGEGHTSVVLGCVERKTVPDLVNRSYQVATCDPT